ncbi:PRC-barrel domain containing protein [Pistricoccus aurantiacus]|uniref:PRC-barrel domain containing protein n=1 Tax=Pistricoccus aurantiacus TaxID=1883414 RepID=A0A5B8SS56_9GAMM|nr:PRC-barrel domain-containing protein [Pistricoccus aurantiacus]QEA39131.1 PRC-barrel domain containing protein [Pistricoccus aurantiacus]
MIQQKAFNKTLLAALVAAGMTVSGSAMAAPQGLYSADELTDAEVFSPQSGDEAIGEVEDILLDEDMKVRAIVVDTSNLLDLGARQYVIDTGKFTVETRNDDDLDDLEYRVNVDMTEEEITQQPEYDNDWWAQTKKSAASAWEDTKQGAQSAWESTKAATSDALTSAGQAIESAGDKTEQATDEAAN